MNVGEVRNCFSKGSVSIGGRGIMVFYTFKERWVTQSIYDEDDNVFMGLLENSDSFEISRVAGKFIKFSFYSELLGKAETVFYNPIEEEVSLQELEDIMHSEPGDSQEFDEFFIGVDLDNEDEIISRALEWVSVVNTRNRGNIRRLMPPARWRKMKHMAETLARILGCFLVCDEPDDDFSGAFEFSFDETSKKSTRLSGEELAKLKAFAEECEGVTIECLIEEGYLNITFSI